MIFMGAALVLVSLAASSSRYLVPVVVLEIPIGLVGLLLLVTPKETR